MTTSTHKVEIVRLNEFHPIEGADRIVMAQVWGYPCVVAKKDAIPGSLWAYIPPDSVVNVNRSEFAFLNAPGNGVKDDGTARIRARKFKGQTSMGLLIPAPARSKEGDDVADLLGVTHYEPPVKGEAFTPPSMGRLEKLTRRIFRRSIKYGEKPPDIHVPYYDIEALRRYPKIFEGHEVIVTEKIHGSNVAYCWKDRGLLYRLFNWNSHRHLRVRSRTVWKRPEANFYHCTAVTEELKEYLRKHPHHVIFGEVYGPGVQKGFDYGVDKPTFIYFETYDHGENVWRFTPDYMEHWHNIPAVPILYQGEYNFELITSLAEGKSKLGGDHVREGVVVRTTMNNVVVRQLKCVGNGYYEKAS